MLPLDRPRRAALLGPWLAAALLAPSLAAAPARAEPPRPAPAARSDAEVEKRLAFLNDRLMRATPAATRWWYGWYGGWTALTLIQAGMAFGVSDAGLRKDAAVGAAFSSLGVLPFGLFSFTPLHAAAALRALPESTPEARRIKLARAEHLLEKSAEDETLGRSFLPHAAGGAASLAACLTVVLAYKRPLFSGLFQLLGGVVLNEAQIFTQPTAAIHDLADYRALDNPSSKPVARPFSPGRSFSFTVVPSPGGLGIGGSF
ncbi:MAG: hypothetical protein U0359_34070 [Byssovorax sp.]